MTLLQIGRRYCAHCNRALCVVYDPDVTEMRCPQLIPRDTHVLETVKRTHQPDLHLTLTETLC